MIKVRKAIEEIKIVLLQIAVFDALLDFILVVLICYFLLIFLPVSQWLVVVGGICFLLYVLYKKIHLISLVSVEERVPELKEELRTAADNLDVRTELEEILEKDVLKNMKKVKISYFMDMKKTGKKIGAAFILSMIIIVLGFLNVEFIDVELDITKINRMPNIFDDIQRMQESFGIEQSGTDNENFKEGEGEVTDEIGAAFSGLDDIFGEMSMAELGEDKEEIFLEPIPTEAMIISDEEDDNTPTLFPQDVVVEETTSETYSDTAEDYEAYQNIISNYFITLTQE